MIQSEIQRKILSQCTFFEKGAKYSELKLTDLENDLFNYHLQKLVKDGFLIKERNVYTITPKGKSFVTNVDERDFNAPPSYKVSVYLCPIQNGQILLTKRLKHPQFGYIGLIAEKKKYGEEIFKTAKRALFEETGLTSTDFKLIGNLHQVRKDVQGTVIEDGVFYVLYTDTFSGKLIEKSIEGEYFWVNLNDVSTLENIFKPSLEVIVEEVKQRLKKEKAWDNQFIYEFLPDPENY